MAHRVPLRLRVISGTCALVGLVLLVPAGYYAYLDVKPPAPRQGDLYLGDGTGFAIAAAAGIPAVVALTAAILVPIVTRRRHS